MIQKLCRSYTLLFDEMITNTTCIVAIVAFLVCCVGVFFSPVHVFANENSAKNSGYPTIVIDGAEYEVILKKVK